MTYDIFFLISFSLWGLVGAEELANKMLQFDPKKRISTTDAMRHHYFSDLPPRIYDLPDGKL